MKVLSIDVGTSFIKAALVDTSEELKIIDYSNIPVETKKPEPLAYEHNPRDVVNAVVKLLKHYSKFKPDVVSLSTYLFGFIAVDSDLKPLTGILTWQDERATMILEQLKPYTRELYQRTGCPPLHIYTLAKILWLRQKHPDILGKTKLFLDAKSYLLSVLTGETVTDYSTASGTYQLLNISNLKWDDLALNIAGIDESKLPSLAEGDTITILRGSIASETNLNGTQLVLGVYDGGSMILGLTGGKSDIAVVNLGTSAMFRTTSNQPVVDSSPLMRFQTYYLLRGVWLSGGGLNNGSVVVDYILKLLYGSIDSRIYEEVFSELSKRVNVEPKVISIPILFPERLPYISSFKRMMLAKLSLEVDRIDVVRGVVEGVLMLLALIDRAMRDNGVKYSEVRVGGKLSQHYFVRYVLSNLLKTRVVYPQIPDAVHVGNSLLALKALESPGKLQQVLDSLLHTAEAVIPNPKAIETYNALFNEFSEIIDKIYISN